MEQTHLSLLMCSYYRETHASFRGKNNASMVRKLARCDSTRAAQRQKGAKKAQKQAMCRQADSFST
jgi:hypothetical protein